MDKNTPAEDGGRRPFVRTPRRERTPEDDAAVAVLDALRAGTGETKPTGLPLACVVKVVDCTDVPKAHDAYSMVTVTGPGNRSWRMCVRRGSVKVGRNMLFVGEDAALPLLARWREAGTCTVKEKVYNFGGGVKVRRLLPHVQHHIYIHNNGVLYPTAAFPELRRARAGTVCAVHLCIDSASAIKAKMMAPRPKKGAPWRP